jgi:hypothetical protein
MGGGAPRAAKMPKESPRRASIVVFCLAQLFILFVLKACRFLLWSTVSRVLHCVSFVFVGFVSRVAVFGQCVALM